MSLRDLAIVYRKELLDLLRDRRTIISMIVVPDAGDAAADGRHGRHRGQTGQQGAPGDSQSDGAGRGGFAGNDGRLARAQHHRDRPRPPGLHQPDRREDHPRRRPDPERVRRHAGQRRAHHGPDLYVWRRDPVVVRSGGGGTVLQPFARPDGERTAGGSPGAGESAAPF